MARIAFFGAGYAGLVSGACFADLGHTVVIRDVVSEETSARIEASTSARDSGSPGLSMPQLRSQRARMRSTALVS